MLDCLACQSLERLVIDAEIIANAKRLLTGVDQSEDYLDLNYYENFEFPGNFLKEKLTRQVYRDEFYLPSPVVVRGSLREWKEDQSLDTFARAKAEAARLISGFQSPELDNSMLQEMTEPVASHARQAGMDRLPAIN